MRWMRALPAALVVAAMPTALVVAATMPAPPTARQAAEDEALVRELVAARLGPLVEEWRERAGKDANLAARLALASLEIRSADDPPAARLAAIVAARRALVSQAIETGDPRRAAWMLDLATDLLVSGPAIDGRVATSAVGIADPVAVARWREELGEAESALAAAGEAIAATPRGPLALPEARAFRRGWEDRHASLASLARGMRASLDGAALPAETAGTPTGAEWNDLALLAAIAAGTEPLRALSVDADRGPWISVAAACAIDLAAGDPRARQRLVDRAAGLARGESPALALLAADAAVRAGPANDPTRFAAWETLLDATPAARRGAVRAAILPKLPSLPPTGPAAAMGDLELAVRSLADPIPPDLAAEIAARGPIPETARGEAARLREFARLRVLASRGELVEAASLAERLANSLGDDPIAAAAAETLVLVRTSLASASTDALAWEAERSALEFAIGRFPRHPGHDRWAIDLALARLAAGESEGALEAVRRVGDASPLGDEARAVEAVALVRTGNAASIARAERLVRESAGGHPAVAARLALADALLMAAAGRIEDARGAADAVVADPTIPATIRAEALRIALELGATPPPHATGAILAALPRARAPLLAALRAGGDRDRTRSLLAALDGSQVALAPEELLAVAAATLAVGDAEPAARRAAEVIANAPRGTPVALAAMLLRAESLRAIGGEANLSEAFTLARDVLRQSAHASPGWWEANALQLEILEASGRNRDQVIPWINRLRAVDADLGGPATRSRIEAVAKRADS